MLIDLITILSRFSDFQIVLFYNLFADATTKATFNVSQLLFDEALTSKLDHVEEDESKVINCLKNLSLLSNSQLEFCR